MNLVIATIIDIFLGAIIAVGWSILFNSPRKVVWIAALLGGLGHSIRYLLAEGFGAHLVLATLAGTITIGLLGIIFSRKADVPPVVFTMPACITMIPGMYAYHSMIGFIRIAETGLQNPDPFLMAKTTHYFVTTIALLFTLSIGITLGSLLFRKKAPRKIELNLKD